MEKKKIKRSNTDKMLAGVCGGLGEYLNIDPTIVRLITAVLALFSCGTVALIYLIAALVIPRSEIV